MPSLLVSPHQAAAALRLVHHMTGNHNGDVLGVELPKVIPKLHPQLWIYAHCRFIQQKDSRLKLEGAQKNLDKGDTGEACMKLASFIDAVEAQRGTVGRFMGDGLMALFGVPEAHEAHAREACACAPMAVAVGISSTKNSTPF